MPRQTAALAALALLATACQDASTGPDRRVAPAEAPALAKAGVKDPTATWLIPLADAGLVLRSDQRYADATNTHSVYANGTCSVATRIFATTESNVDPSGDATISMTHPSGGRCGRTVTIAYPDAAITESLATFSNLNKLQDNGDATTIIPVGGTALRRLIVGFEHRTLGNPTSGRCGRVIFGDNGSVGAGTDMLRVTRLDARTWRVQSQQPPSDRALCEKTGTIIGGMTVDFTVVASRDLPTS